MNGLIVSASDSSAGGARAAHAAAMHAAALDEARRELEHTISCVHEARRAGSGVAASDAAWRQAKFGVIESETAHRPSGVSRTFDVREVNGDGNGNGNEGDSS